MIQTNQRERQGELIAIPGNIYDRSNLTRLQLLYWVGQKLRPESPLFSTILIHPIPGEVHYEQFAEAFHLVVAGSDALRTIFGEVNGLPQRQILDTPPSDLVYVDLSYESDPHQKFLAWRQSRLETSLNVERAVYDSVLVKLAQEQFIWYLNLHHLIADGVTCALVYQQTQRVYESLVRGDKIEPPHLPLFEEYAKFERSFRTSSRYPKAVTYWQQRLSKGLDPLRFYGRTPIKRSAKVRRVSYELDAGRTNQLRAMAAQAGISVLTRQLAFSNLLVTLFFAQLHLMTHNRRLAVMLPFHNRPTPVLKETIGLLMELCPLPVEITPDETFVSLYKKVNQEMQRALLHYQYGSELILQDNPFDIAFNYVHRPAFMLNGMPISQDLLHSGYGSDTFGLHIHDFEGQESLTLYFDFHEDVFIPQERDDTVQLFLSVVDAFLANNSCRIDQLVMPETSPYAPIPHEKSRIPELPKRPIIPPSNSLELKLRHIWEEVVGVKPISIRDNFFDLGGSSWLAMRVFTRIEEATGQYLPLATLLQADTIEKLADLLRRQSHKGWSSLVTVQEGSGGKRPFFCVPGAAGNSLVIARIAQYIQKDQPVYTFLMPGLMDGTPPLTDVEAQAAYYVNSLREVQAHGPYLLGGYSVGGVVAYEMAQQLLAQGEMVALLAIIDVPIQSPRLRIWRERVNRLGNRLNLTPEQRRTWFLFIRDLSFRVNYWRDGGLRESWARSKRRLHWFLYQLATGKPPITRDAPRQVEWEGKVFTYTLPPTKDADGSQLEDPRLKNIFEINDRAVRSYIPQPYPGQVILFKSFAGYTRSELRTVDPTMGWGEIAQGGVEIYQMPAGHLVMVSEPLVSVLGEKLYSCIERVQKSLES